MSLSFDRLWFFLKRLRERLWVKPLVICLLSIAAALVARLADGTRLAQIAPAITLESVETLLSIMAASMLVIATFAVASMVSAYNSASSSATPRSFSLVVADDVSQNALSTFIGAFIFSIVALTTVKNGFFATAGLFTLFVLTVIVFAMVILTFVRWVDRIARLGRLGTTIDAVEKATALALKRRRNTPTLHGVSVTPRSPRGQPVFAPTVGYVQHIDIAALQAYAENNNGRVTVAALPGTFTAPGQPLAYISVPPGNEVESDYDPVVDAFLVGGDRRFDDDPRFGLVVLSEIASRALSPAVNDPGTAICTIGTLVRLFVGWGAPDTTTNHTAPKFNRVEVPELSLHDMFDDAFMAIGRDGAGVVEVATRLMKALRSLAQFGEGEMRDAAISHTRISLARAQKALDLPADLAAVRDLAAFAEATPLGAPHGSSMDPSSEAPFPARRTR